MKPEGFRHGVQGEGLDIIGKFRDRFRTRRIVDPARGIFVALLLFHRLWAYVSGEDRADQELVLVIGHTSTIIDLSAQEIQNRVRGFLVLVDKQHQLLSAHLQVFGGKAVCDIPSDWPELPPVLHHRVEEAEAKEEHLESLGLIRLREHLVRQLREGAQEICTQTRRRFIRHLHPVLQHLHREGCRWHRCEPEAEVVGHRLWVQLLNYSLERRHP
mmetsp:Transcript_42958/g.91569  ORF Transcript_42958/g.91569 Transcript_42958/m.91569 type:complete len:215 (-) Transcript_42958:3224-3868(-)